MTIPTCAATITGEMRRKSRKFREIEDANGGLFEVECTEMAPFSVFKIRHVGLNAHWKKTAAVEAVLAI